MSVPPDSLNHPILRLDSLINPYAPTDAVADALGDAGQFPWSIDERIMILKQRLGRQYGVDHRWIMLGAGVEDLYAALLAWRTGPIVTFPPTGHPEIKRIACTDRPIIPVRRQPDFSLGIEPGKSQWPDDATAIAMSPNDPTGTLAQVHEMVRLTRQAGLTVVDERHGGYSPRTMAPMTREFDNLLVIQSMEWWAGLRQWPLAWAIAPPSTIEQLAEHRPSNGPTPEAVLAALATLDDWSWVKETLRRVTIEKGRLYRQLRKLSMISPPYPSWSNFLLARFERGGAAFFLPRLEKHGLYLHDIDDALLPNHVRISAVSSEATDVLKRALIEIALDL